MDLIGTSEIGEGRDSDFDAVVVGGGPAGSSAALTLAREGYRVALFDCRKADDFEGGETLPPEITPLLRTLGVFEDFLTLRPIACPGVVSAWGSAVLQETDYIKNPYGCGWHVDRKRFDAILIRAARGAGVSTYLDCPVREYQREANGPWRVLVGGVNTQLHCRLVIDATGRNGLGGSARYRREHDDPIIALVFEFAADLPADARTYIESAPCGWWYSAPVPRGVLAAMFFTDRQTYVNHEIAIDTQLRACPLTDRRIGARQPIRQQIVQARSALNSEPARDAWISAGDSASSYDPIAGAGIWKAIRQGIAAADAARRCLQGSAEAVTDYADHVRRDFEKYTAKRRQYYTAEKRWPNEIFWWRWRQ